MHPTDPTPLCGLAHGAAGVALAFEGLAALDPDPRWAAEADAARLFERLHFDPAQGSWADLRPDCQPEGGGPPFAPHFWCHGSVGVGHDRLAALARRPGCPVLAADATAALMGARADAERLIAGPAGGGAGYLANGSLCHGLSGSIDLLVGTGEAADRALALRIAAFVRNDAGRPGGWRCGIPSGEPTPALMTGLAGIAWGQLRAARPGEVPAGWDPCSGLGERLTGPAKE
jgi:lantibiotic modifying enzyme